MSLIDNGIDTIGSSVTLQTVTVTQSEDVYGTATYAYANSTINAIITAPNKNDRLLALGVITAGDMVGTVKSTQAIKEGDLITYDGSDWEVVIVTVATYQSSTTHKRVGLKRRA